MTAAAWPAAVRRGCSHTKPHWSPSTSWYPSCCS